MDMVRKSRDHEALNAAGEDLIKSSDKDHDAVNDTLKGINDRWEDLMNGKFT